MARPVIVSTSTRIPKILPLTHEQYLGNFNSNFVLGAIAVQESFSNGWPHFLRKLTPAASASL